MKYYLKSRKHTRYLGKTGNFDVRDNLSGDAMSFDSEDAAFQQGKSIGMDFADIDVIWTDVPERRARPEPTFKNGKTLSEMVPAKYRS